jgi:hypothetical protein
MPSLTVYTEETFYYEDQIRVVARQDTMNGSLTSLTFYKEDMIWFLYEIQDSIYTMQGMRALLVCKMKEHGYTPDFLYSCKWIEYSCSEKEVVDTVDFYITESDQPGVLSVMEQINRSPHFKAWNLNTRFYDFTGIRQFTDAIFYGTFVKNE